jgi:hypothetical protein
MRSSETTLNIGAFDSVDLRLASKKPQMHGLIWALG